VSSHPDLTPLHRGDELPRAERQELLEHLHGCAACRATVVREDPSALFSLLALEPIPDTVLARVSRGVAERVTRETRRVSTRRAYAFGSLAASVLLAALLGVYMQTRESPPATPPMPAQLVDVDSAAGAESAIPAGFFEVLDSPGSAEVINLSVEGLDIVMIFDEKFDL